MTFSGFLISDIEHPDHLEDVVRLEEVLVPFSLRPEGGGAAAASSQTLDLLPGSDPDWSCLGLDVYAVSWSRSKLPVYGRSGSRHGEDQDVCYSCC